MLLHRITFNEYGNRIARFVSCTYYCKKLLLT